MNIQTLKEKLLEDPQKIEQLLETFEFHNIKTTTNEIRCGHGENSNSTSIRIKLCEGLPSVDFSKSIKGDIFSVISSIKNIKLFDVFLCCKSILGIDDSFTFKRYKIFGGVYENIRKQKKQDEDPITYPDTLLLNYEQCCCKRFSDDGIKVSTQKLFEVGYDYDTHRITVPWRTSDGRLLGVMGRYNGRAEDTHAKWFPTISFSKKHSLYGFYQNYSHIVEQDTIYIGESEKFVMQLHSMGIRNCVALGGNSIGLRQIKEILSTSQSNIIFCYDEGLDIKQVINECLKVKSVVCKFGVKVGYVYDKDNVWLKQNSKCSPTDLGFDVWNNLIQNCIVYV